MDRAKDFEEIKRLIGRGLYAIKSAIEKSETKLEIETDPENAFYLLDTIRTLVEQGVYHSQSDFSKASSWVNASTRNIAVQSLGRSPEDL